MENDEIITNVTDLLWFQTLQALPVPNPRCNTVSKTFPKHWALVVKFLKEWKDLGWYKALNPGSNSTNLKERIVEHLNKKKKLLPRREIPQVYIESLLLQAGENSTKSHYYYYSKQQFLKWSESQFKHDLAAVEKKEKPTVNDIIRLFHIATGERNRDTIVGLGYGKAFRRSDLDTNMTMFETAMTKFAIEFNDDLFQYLRPARSVYLHSYQDLNPNDPERIAISRDSVWIGKLYKKVLSEYNSAFQRWTKGTGGGSGADEDFDNWEERDQLELFANYADHGSVDYLAYLLMLDKSANYVINTINDPAPADTVTEDGASINNSDNQRTPKRKRKTSTTVDKLASTAKDMQEDMRKMFKETLSVLNGKGEGNTEGVRNNGEVARLNREHMALDGMSKCYEIIRNLDSQISLLNQNEDENNRDGNLQLRILEKAKMAAYKKLQNFSE